MWQTRGAVHKSFGVYIYNSYYTVRCIYIGAYDSEFKDEYRAEFYFWQERDQSACAIRMTCSKNVSRIGFWQ